MLKVFIISSFVAAATAIFNSAVVDIVAGGNTQIRGTLFFKQNLFGIIISGVVKGLSPGLHGFHVHEIGDTSNACAAAGGHFNPLGTTHGGPSDAIRHAGDFGNIRANSFGDAWILIVDNHISLDPNSKTFIGNLAVVVHAGVDDLGRGGNPESLTTGNAGSRDGCGIIRTTLTSAFRRQQPVSMVEAQSNFYRPIYHYALTPYGYIYHTVP